MKGQRTGAQYYFQVDGPNLWVVFTYFAHFDSRLRREMVEHTSGGTTCRTQCPTEKLFKRQD